MRTRWRGTDSGFFSLTRLRDGAIYGLAYILKIYAISYIAQLSELAYMWDMKNVMAQIARTPKQLGDALRRHRTHIGLSQSQVAAKAGLRQATISQIENGHDATKVETICALLAALDLELTVVPRSKGSPKDIEDIF